MSLNFNTRFSYLGDPKNPKVSLPQAEGAPLKKRLGLRFSQRLLRSKLNINKLSAQLATNQNTEAQKLEIFKKSVPYFKTYEASFANDATVLSSLAKEMAFTQFFQQLDRLNWISILTPADYVFIAALFRRLAQTNALKNSNLDALITPITYIVTHDELIKKYPPSPVYTREQEIFTKVATSPPPLLAQNAIKSADSQLRAQGWFSLLNPQLFTVENFLRQGYWAEALNALKKKNVLPNKLAAPLLRKQCAKVLALTYYLNKDTDCLHASTRDILEQELGKQAQSNSLFDDEKYTFMQDTLFPEAHNNHPDTQFDAIRTLWVQADGLYHKEPKSPQLSIILEELSNHYNNAPQTRLNNAKISTDVFIIKHLKELLDVLQNTMELAKLPPIAIAAFAHCAIICQHNDVLKVLIGHLNAHPSFSPAIKAILRNTYFTRGIHNVNLIHDLPDITSMGVYPQFANIDKSKKILCLIENNANVSGFNYISEQYKNVTAAPITTAMASALPSFIKQITTEDKIPAYSQRDLDLSGKIETLCESIIKTTQQEFERHEQTKPYADYVEVAHSALFFTLYRTILGLTLADELLDKVEDYDCVIFFLRSGSSFPSHMKKAIEHKGHEHIFVCMENIVKANFEECVKNIASLTLPYIVRPALITPPTQGAVAPLSNENWFKEFHRWTNNLSSRAHLEASKYKNNDYALHLFEQVNGYNDGYRNLIIENLKYNNVDLVRALGNKNIQDFLDDPYTQTYQVKHNLTTLVPSPSPLATNKWAQPLIEKVSAQIPDTVFALLPDYTACVLQTLKTSMRVRLNIIMSSVNFFQARFAVKLPTNIFTSPNQHISSRIASILGQKHDIPVYDFLILANAAHPRYRPPIADYVYIYSEWYRDLYENYFNFPKKGIRHSGSLLNYHTRLMRPIAYNKKNLDKTHIIFFSQSGNTKINYQILDAILTALTKRDNVFLTVKMHPHEAEDNQDIYTEFINDNSKIKHYNIIHQQQDSVDLINQADLVIQSFSNIGLDAYLLEKPVISTMFGEKPCVPQFTYEKNIGHRVSNRAELSACITQFLDDENFRTSLHLHAQEFTRENADFLSPDNTQNVMREVLLDLENKKQNRKRLV